MSHAERDLKLVEEKIEKLEKIVLHLKKKNKKEGLDSDEEVELEFNSEKLKELKAKEKQWLEIIKESTKGGSIAALQTSPSTGPQVPVNFQL